MDPAEPEKARAELGVKTMKITVCDAITGEEIVEHGLGGEILWGGDAKIEEADALARRRTAESN